MVERCRLHVVGASGTGTSTLGRAIASAWHVPYADVDDYFWEPTDSPYRVKRPRDERVALMQQVFAPRRSWVLSGSMLGWGEEIVRLVDAVVFLTLDPVVRMRRLRAREQARLGVAPSADDLVASEQFLQWAQSYDDPRFEGRSRRGHEDWLGQLPCPVLRISAAKPVRELVETVLSWTPPEPPAMHDVEGGPTHS